MSAMSKNPPRLKSPLRIHVALSVCLVPFLLSLSCFAIALSWYDRLPDSVAIHFGTRGEPDDWMGKNANYAFDAIFMFGFNALNLGLSYFGLMRGRSGQVTGALLAGTVGLVSPLLLATLYFQLDGAEAHLGGNAFLFGLAGAIVCAGVTALTFPTHATEPEKPSHSDARRAPRESLRSGEKAAYFGGQSGNPALLGSVAALILGSTILVAFVDWWAVAITLVAGIIAIPLIAYLRVRIDQTAVTWAFGFGLPRGSIALSASTPPTPYESSRGLTWLHPPYPGRFRNLSVLARQKGELKSYETCTKVVTTLTATGMVMGTAQGGMGVGV